MAESRAKDIRKSEPGGFRPSQLDARSLALALLLTALLAALIMSLGEKYRNPDETTELLTVFDNSSPSQDEEPPPLEMPQERPDQPEEKSDASSPPPAPAPAPDAGAPDLPVVPIPDIKLAPLTVPEVVLPATGRGLAGRDGMRNLGAGATDGNDTGGNGAGGTGSGGSGTGGGKGARRKLSASWAPEMDLAQLDRFYPEAATETGDGGVALLKCKASRGNRVRDCSLVDEHPRGLGFGRAALASEKILRVQVHDESGRRVYNEWFILRAEFRKPEPIKKEMK